MFHICIIYIHVIYVDPVTSEEIGIIMVIYIVFVIDLNAQYVSYR